jgi:hypothetical protein
LTQLVEDGLRLLVQTQTPTNQGRPVRLPVFEGRGGLAPRVRFDSNQALLDAADIDNDDAA